MLYRRRTHRSPPSPAIQPTVSPFSSIAGPYALKAFPPPHHPSASPHRLSTTLHTSASALDLQLADMSSSPVHVHLTDTLTSEPDYHVTAGVGGTMGTGLMGMGLGGGGGGGGAQGYRGTHVKVGATVGATMMAGAGGGVGGTGGVMGPGGDFRTVGMTGTAGGEGGGVLALPAVWKMYKDGNGRKFYYNTCSGESRWTEPEYNY